MKINRKLKDEKERRKEIIENKIINWIAVVAAGQLIIEKPSTDSVVADIFVKKRGEYYEGSPAYIKIEECRKLDGEKTYKAEIIEGEFEPKENLYLIFLYFDIVVQDIADYVWLIPSIKFCEMAESTVSDGQKVLIFEAPTNIKTENRYSRFLISKKNLAKILEEITDKGDKFIFPERGLMGLTDFKTEDLKKFIIDSRRNTFAGNGAPIDNPRLKGSKQLEFQKGDWFYQDIYFSGKTNLIGQELVYYNARPVWSMGYFGDQLPEKTAEFLKQTLFKLADKCRFGERCELEKKEFYYEDQGGGTLDKFSGQERIFMAGKNIYKLNYQGGLISR